MNQKKKLVSLLLVIKRRPSAAQKTGNWKLNWKDEVLPPFPLKLTKSSLSMQPSPAAGDDKKTKPDKSAFRVAVRCRPWIGRQNEADEATRRCIVTMSDGKVFFRGSRSAGWRAEIRVRSRNLVAQPSRWTLQGPSLGVQQYR